ncbi:MAG: nicotinic acid mononucleotide adenyltransferase [Flavobacteriaceae bacterium]
MKKLILILAVAAIGLQGFAQETTKKQLVKNGDLIEAKMFHENGIVSQEGQYTLDGKLQGTWISYDVNGNKTAVAKYNKGEKVGTWYFYEGDVLHEVNYNNSKIAKVTTWKDSEQVVSNFE